MLSGRYQLDTDFLVWAIDCPGPERSRLLELSRGDHELRMSAVAWYEFCRGPRTPGQQALAEVFLSAQGVVPLTRPIAELAADWFRRVGSPRKRANDIVIGATALSSEAVLLTRNRRDFEDLDGLRVEQPGE